MLSHHTWSPRAPLINVVAQCMPASEPKWLFFWRPFEAKRCNNIELGERGHASFFAMSLTGWLFFEEPGLSPGKIFWFTDVQTQAWTLHLPQPQSKHTLIFKAATQQTKKHNIFLFMAVQTQAWTNSLLHVPQPQSKDTFIFTAATHKQRMCLHASRSRIAQTVFCTVHVQCAHSARYSACHSARPQNAVNTMGLAFCWQFLQKTIEIFSFFLCFLIIFGKRRGIYSVLWPCTVACTVPCTVRALYVHCAKHNVCAPLYFHQQNAAILLLEACRHILHWCTMQGTQLWSPIFTHVRSKCCNVASLFVGSSSEDESVFELGFWHVQKGICSSLRLHIHKRKKTNLLRLCLVGSRFEAASVLGLRFWQMQKRIGSRLYLHIHKPIFFGLKKKTAILLHVVTSHLIPLRPLDQCCCLMHAGIRTEMAVFFWRPFEAKRRNNIELGEKGHASFFAMSLIGWLFVVKNPDSVRERVFWFTDVQTQAWTNYLLHLPQPQSKHTLIFKAATQQTKKHKYFFVYGCANASLNKFPFARATTPIQRHVHLHSCYPQTKNVPPRLQKQNCTNCVLHSARTVHAQCTVQCMPRSARPQNAVNTMGLAFCWQFTKTIEIFFLCVFWLFLGKYVVFTAFCGRALWRAL